MSSRALSRRSPSRSSGSPRSSAWSKFGEVGDTFDPRIHEALLHNYSDEVDGPTATLVMQPGYRLGERILRAARVAVSEPTEQLPADPTGDG